MTLNILLQIELRLSTSSRTRTGLLHRKQRLVHLLALGLQVLNGHSIANLLYHFSFLSLHSIAAFKVHQVRVGLQGSPVHRELQGPLEHREHLDVPNLHVDGKSVPGRTIQARMTRTMV